MRVDDVTCRASYSTRPGLRVCRRCDRTGRTIHMSAYICRSYVIGAREAPPSKHKTKIARFIDQKTIEPSNINRAAPQLLDRETPNIKQNRCFYAVITFPKKPPTNKRLTRVQMPSARARDRHKTKTPIRGAHRARKKCESTFITLSFFARCRSTPPEDRDANFV